MSIEELGFGLSYVDSCKGRPLVGRKKMNQRVMHVVIPLALGVVMLSGIMVTLDESMPALKLLSRPEYQQAWMQMLENEDDVPRWLRKAQGSVGTMENLVVNGESVQFSEFCGLSDCTGRHLFVAFHREKLLAAALLVTVADNVSAEHYPSKYATYRWFGNPSDEMREVMLSKLRATPNWK